MMNNMRKLMEAVAPLSEDTAFRDTSDMLKYVLRRLKSLHDEAQMTIGGGETRKPYRLDVDDLWADYVVLVDEIESLLNQMENAYVMEELDEAGLRRDDEDMLDYDVERGAAPGPAADEMRDAPYYVEWNAQSWEWYGDDDPSTGRGRYKPKGDGGRVVAINVPSYEQAQKIADKLDSDYEDGSFEDKNVYGKQGQDGYVLDYHGANVGSMAKMDEFTKRELEYVHPNFKPVDYTGKK